MSWISISTNRFCIFISVDTTPISIHADMSWIFINSDRTPNSINADMSWIFINADRTPNSINLICLGYLFPRIDVGYLFLEIRLQSSN